MAKDWISLRKASKIIGVAYPTATRLRIAGHLRCVKVGGIYRVYQYELERFMKEGNYVPKKSEMRSGEGD